jgi:hypothetical protein
MRITSLNILSFFGNTTAIQLAAVLMDMEAV